MKKTTLFTVLLLLSTFVFGQENDGPTRIGMNKMTFTENKGSLTSFMIFGKDKDVYITNLIQLIGQPLRNDSGTLLWENVTIDGLGKVSRIRLYDGLLTNDARKGYACFYPFKSAEDKQEKLAGQQSNQVREVQIQFLDKEGNCIIHTNEQVELSKKFLARAIKK
jgi:hypothetical protein